MCARVVLRVAQRQCVCLWTVAMASPVGADRAAATASGPLPGAGVGAGDDGGEEAKGGGFSMKVPVRFKGAGGEEVLVQLNARICTGLKVRSR